ncbi:MAG: CvpA family protein [Oscillospiraceae bacterium]|jgi:uncharacterized membrane protein required for colicin V production|nr:CvpA family protein [Oscillospiraceae bacterium]
MGILIDIVLVAAIGFAAYRGVKNGLIRGAISLASLVICLVLANAAAGAFSADFQEMLTPFVGGLVQSKYTEVTGMTPGRTDGDYTSPSFDDPDRTHIISDETLRRLGVFEPVARKITETVEREVADFGAVVTDVMTEKISSALARIAVFAVAFALLAIACVVVGNLVNLVFSLPGLKLVDSVLGGVLGALKGVFLVLIVALVLRNLGILTAGTIEKTGLLEYFVLHNPIANILGL